MKLPKRLKNSQTDYTGVFIQDENNRNIVIASAFISGDEQKEILKELCNRYNNYPLTKWWAVTSTVAFCVLFTYLQCKGNS